MRRHGVVWSIVSLSIATFIAACSTAAPGQPSGTSVASPPPTATAAPLPSASSSAEPTSPAPSASDGTSIVLREAPANMGCDTIGIDYKTLTFRIDPLAEEQVAAQADTGVLLTTYWSAGFTPGTDRELNVRDPNGEVVVANGEVLQVPAGAYPRLHGYFVCLAPDKLYVLAVDPS